MKEMFDHKYQKRAAMWSELERTSIRERFKERSRVEERSRKVRVNRRKLNDFLVQMPENFRYTNLTPRHPGGARPSKDPIESSTDGDFEFWDRPEDPPSDEERASGKLKRPLEEAKTTYPKAKRAR
jgi:hypothetical protein